MSSFGYDLLGFGSSANTAVDLPSDDEFNRVSFLSHFDGANNGVNNAFDDGSTSNHTITANGNVTQGSFGPFARPDGEWGVSFDGDGDKLTLAASSDFAAGTGDFTFETFLFKTETTSSSQYDGIFYSATTQRIKFQASDSIIHIQTSARDVAIVNNDQGTFIGVWRHLAVCRSSNTLRTYVDGTLATTITLNSDETFGTSSPSVIIGQNGDYFGGLMSNFRYVVGSALHTGSSLTVPTAPLTAVTNTKLLTCQSNRFVDNSASGHTVTPSGNAAVSAFGPFLTTSVYDPAVNAASAYFDGTGDALIGPTSSDFQFGNNSFTVECFIFPTLIRNYCSPITCLGSTGAGRWYLTYGATSMYWGTYGNGTDGDLTVTHGMTPNAWYHLAYVRDKSDDKGRLYINGVQKGVWDDARTYGNPSNPLRLGRDNGTANNMVGYISDARVVNGTAVYTSAFTPPTAPLTAITNTTLLLNMAEGQAIDSAAQSNLTLAGNAKISSTQSKFGGTSMVFDGTGDYAFAPHKDIYNLPGDFTVEFWAYISSNDTTSIIGQWNANEYSWIVQDLVTSLRFYTGNNGSLGSGLTFSWSRNLNQWYHIAVTRSGTTIRGFLDGALLGTHTNSDNLSGSDSLSIGYNKDGGIQHFNGHLDEVRISNGVARYTSAFTPPTAAFPDKGQ